jgi:hypothetical protein
MIEMRNYEANPKNHKESDCLEDLDVDERILLKK